MSDTSPGKIYIWARIRQLTIWVHIRQIMFMADCNSPDEIYYGRELARKKYMGESSPDITYVHG